ncbi:Ada metal-binding domain-containing protein, partial [Klebsiella pneumoniae]|uniref:Ada metal-binding domain-containing protein n=1 Tax=Klebsiella pneumoniae TaxID=573 RepID=UPI00113718BE
MKPIVADTDDRRWQAVCERDTRADGQFVFAVLTTGICCRPSCPARRPPGANVRVFCDLAPPGAGGIRPRKTGHPGK